MRSTRTCPVCHKDFIPNFDGRVCCSAVCRDRKRGTLEERFFAHVQKTDGCWLWVGHIESSGYGRTKINGKKVSAHRWSYELNCGEIPGGLCVLHKCDNRRCVRPSHLFLGTHQDNTDDMRKKGRRTQRGETHGRAKVTEMQVLEMRRIYKAGGVTQTALAKKYGLHPVYLHQILVGNAWAHLRG